MRFLFLLCFGLQFSLAHAGLESWGIQLQNYEGSYDLNRIRQSSIPLWVIDLGDPFTSFQIDQLKSKNKKIISYMSIGEAESYRFYFPSLDPQLKGKVNPKWKENFDVNFWEPNWQKVFVEGDPKMGPSYLDRIMDTHFDGVFLDVIDAFDRHPDPKLRAQQMADFVMKISQRAKAKKPDFLIIIQNGIHIRRHLKNEADFMKSIDGVNVESGFFENGKAKVDDDLLKDIETYKSAGKFVLSLEYLSDKTQLEQYWSLAQKYGLRPVSAERKLNGPLIFPESK